MEAYIFRARCYNVVDGDTIDCKVDVGFGMTTKQRFRLWGVNTPEKRTGNAAEKARAYEAEEFTASMVYDTDIMIQTYKDDVFGRYLARVYVPHNLSNTDVDLVKQEYLCLNDLLIIEGLAVPFMKDEDLLR